MTILTTNHLTNIHPSLLRPGRLDALIKLDLPSAEVRAKMLAHYADAEPKTDWLAAAEACHDTDGDGYPGAAIREVAERADRYAYLAGRSLCTTDDLISVAHSMRAHIDLTKERAAAERPQLDLAMRDIINSTTKGRAKVKISD
jgi:ATP-dependent 26S proteasome regulatory subunit